MKEIKAMIRPVMVEVGAAYALRHRDRQQTISGCLIASTWALKWYGLDGILPDSADAGGWNAVFAGEPILARETSSEPEWPLQPA